MPVFPVRPHGQLVHLAAQQRGMSATCLLVSSEPNMLNPIGICGPFSS
jgi:hypothetical protein